jgi:hypothetical protein
MKKKFFLIALLSILTFLPSAYALYYGPSTLLHFVDPYDLQGIEDKFDRLRNMLRSDLENDTRSERSTKAVFGEANTAPSGIGLPAGLHDPVSGYQVDVSKQPKMSLILGAILLAVGMFGGRRFVKN